MNISCFKCGTTYDLPVTQEQLERLKTEKVQDVLPNLTAGERELFISGYCNTCFEAMIASMDFGMED